jgi:hypothetical protein
MGRFLPSARISRPAVLCILGLVAWAAGVAPAHTKTSLTAASAYAFLPLPAAASKCSGGCLLADVDGDGDVDLIGGGSTFRVWLNDGRGGLQRNDAGRPTAQHGQITQRHEDEADNPVQVEDFALLVDRREDLALLDDDTGTAPRCRRVIGLLARGCALRSPRPPPDVALDV